MTIHKYHVNMVHVNTLPTIYSVFILNLVKNLLNVVFLVKNLGEFRNPSLVNSLCG